jgi:acyl-CoA synthetase (AMP-forming)/AMP-acid ligase II
MTVTVPTGPAHVYSGGQPDPVVPDRTLPDFLFAAASRRADHPALIDGPTGRALSYRQLADGVGRVASGLIGCGLGRGDVVAMMAPNSPEWLLGCYGAMTAGGVVTGVNPLCTPREVASQLAQTGARFLVTVPPFLDGARAAIAESGNRCEIVLIGPEILGCIPFDRLLTADGPPPAVDVGAADLALLPCSSGTSGLPKSVRLTHRACVANVLQQRSAVPYSEQDRVLAVAPFFHATGFAVVANGVLFDGGTVITMPRFDVEQMLEWIQNYRITATVVVPPIVLALAKHPAVDRYDLSSLRWLACGAAPLGAELQQACAQRLGRPVLQGYGMTELTAGIAIWPVDRPVRPGAAGWLLPGVRARVVDPVTGADLPPGGTGEIWWRSPSAMAGYLGNPEATAEALDADGWLHSGDIGRIEPDGALWVVDRLKELIKVKGFQVAPAELEAVLRTHPDIREAAVVPMPDERAGERPKAFVVRTGPLTAEDVMAWVAERVAPHKRLGAVEFIDAVPTSPSGKTLRRLLRAP